MGEVIQSQASNLPAHLQNVVGQDAFKEFSAGVQSGFPVISYRGRTWRVRHKGEEKVYLNDQGEAVQSVEVVFVQSNERLSKTYYEGKYREGDQSKPRCWSANGLTPDADVENKVSATCAGCPMNEWGSRITENGNKTRACQDVRRVAVVSLHELEQVHYGQLQADKLSVMLLRIPPASLNPLKDYVEKVLQPKGIPPFVLGTRIGFDTDVAYPKLTFKPARWLSETEFGAVSGLRDSDMVRRVLDTSAEHVDEGTTEGSGEAASSVSTANAEAPASAPSAASANTEEQHFSEAVEVPPAPAAAPAPAQAAPAPAAAAAPAPQAAPAPAPAAPAPAPAPQRAAAVEQEAIAQPPQQPVPQTQAAPAPVPAPAAESPSADPDIEAMLSSVLD